MGKHHYRKGDITYRFVALPKPLLDSQQWHRLSYRARALAIDLMNQYTGRNNGRLCPSYGVVHRSGWTSKDQLAKAKRELLDCEFAIQTRMGHPPRTAEWIGFTWWHLDWEPSMDVSPRNWPYMNILRIEQERIDPNEGRRPINGKQFAIPAARGTNPEKGPLVPRAAGDGIDEKAR